MKFLRAALWFYLYGLVVDYVGVAFLHASTYMISVNKVVQTADQNNKEIDLTITLSRLLDTLDNGFIW